MARLTEMSKVIVTAIQNQLPNANVADYDGELEDLMQLKSLVPKFPLIRIIIAGFDNEEDSGDGARTFSQFRTYAVLIVVITQNIRSLNEAADSAYELMDEIEIAVNGKDLGMDNASALNLANASLENDSFINNIVAYTMNFDWQFLRDNTND